MVWRMLTSRAAVVILACDVTSVCFSDVTSVVSASVLCHIHRGKKSVHGFFFLPSFRPSVLPFLFCSKFLFFTRYNLAICVVSLFIFFFSVIVKNPVLRCTLQFFFYLFLLFMCVFVVSFSFLFRVLFFFSFFEFLCLCPSIFFCFSVCLCFSFFFVSPRNKLR